MVRGCLVSAVYHKTTQAPVSASDDSAAVTLMSSDIERIRTGLMSLHEFWASPIQAAVACWLLQRQLGAAFAAPVVVIAICVACSVLMMRFIGPRQVAWMQRIQKRVGHTANVIGNMKHLKISGMMGVVEESVQQLRVNELKVGGKFRVFVLVAVAIGFTPVLLGPVFTFAVTTRSLDATTIFTSISYLLLLSEPLSNLFQMAPELLAAFACLDRVQAFLEKDARNDSRKDANLVVPSEKRDGKDTELPAITISNASFGWTEDVMTLTNINCSIPLGLTIVVGPVASGKSTFCKALLGEMPVVKGRVIMHTKFHRVGFCEQVPFLPNASIRDTIVGFSAFNEERYAAVLEAVMLLRDLELLAQGDQTRIGSSGIALSGGQKQRISLARALYLPCDLLILDDVLSGLDSDTEGHVFRRVFGPEGILKQRNSTAVLCTHAVRHLLSADHIIALGSDGTIVEQGRFDDLFKSEGKTRSLEIEQRTTTTQPASPSQEEIQRTRIADIPTPATQPDEEKPAGVISDRAVFKHYCRSIGGFWLASFVIFGMLCGLLYNVPSIWLNFWSKDVTSDRPRRTTSFYVGLYALYQCLALLTLIVEVAIGMLIIVRNSGTNLHEKALKTLISAPLRFFATTDTGVVTNLFSQDMTLIDGELPHALTNTSLEFWNAVGAAIVIATSSPYVIITYPFVIAILYGVQKFYLRTSRQLRLLDLEAKSPLYTHFLDTIKGVVTLRAFGRTEESISFNNTLLDTSQRPAYLLSMVQRWLAFVLGMVTAVIAVLVVTLATQLRPTTGFTGASMVSLMTFGRTLANLVQMYTLLETSIGAVGRLKSFNNNTAPEDLPGEDYVPPASWPEKGRIVISDVSATYGDPSSSSSAGLDQYALRDLNLSIEPGEKVAICGRTGRPLNTPPAHHRPPARPGLPPRRYDHKNLDPSATASDEICQAVLEAVGLWGLIYDRGGLLAEMVADDVLSHGQKQLFSLARAVLRRRLRGLGGGGLLILDEFSSSVDPETERTMHGIIMHEFDGYTVIMVSHRLEMVMGFDRVIIMDAGRVMEQGPPPNLAENEKGWSRDLSWAGKTGGVSL
ncbi:hypothetical protein N8I77_008378 [Diaporthe amygdali]|uniref:Uncharacterized protein n=1 Tax=Phomopsis amygdali TaxID=1214568 RepID=A0AAD9SD80_PHOAM|nr:hypothetical protein N8I77_008378 [Diaporthe amygdali]